MRVLVCFDRPQESKSALESVKAGAPKGTICIALDDKKLTSALQNFFTSVRGVLESSTAAKSLFDGYDIIILDNNLTHLDIKGARLTGEAVAGYIRGFTTTPYVVSVNKNPDVDFDLEYLIGDFSTRADLAVSSNHLENRGLWTGRSKDAEDGFRPWYWPTLAEAFKRRRRQIKFVQENLKRPILSALQFPKSAILGLSRHAKGVLSPEGQQPPVGGTVDTPIAKVTFEQFFRSSSRSLPAEDDREELLKQKNAIVVSRIVAGDLDLWLRRDVIGPQEVLVDVPHLVMRMPFLLGNEASDIELWNATVARQTQPFGLNSATYRRLLAQHRCRQELWLPNPAFWGPSLRDDEKLNELFFVTREGKWGDFVFCEDTSAFAKRGDSSGSPKEFVAEFESPWDRRYVGMIADKHYVPRSRLAL